MRVLLVVSVALLLLCLSVNMLPARSFLESITDISKRQNNQLCLNLFQPCSDDWTCLFHTIDPSCLSKIKIDKILKIILISYR